MDKLNKKYILSRNNDIDGLGCIVLARVAFGKEVDTVLVKDKFDLETRVRRLIEDSSIYQCEQVFITSLPLINPSYEISSNCPYLSSHLQVIDHHQSTVDSKFTNLNFVDARSSDNGRVTCSTELFYNYLLENNYLNRTKALDDFVELTRIIETWDYQDNLLSDKARDLETLFKVFTLPTRYIALVTYKLKSNPNNFELDQLEKDIIYSFKINKVVETAAVGPKLKLVSSSFE